MDVNNDTLSDIVIGAPGAVTSSYAKGAAYVFYGTNSVMGSVSTTLWGQNAGDQFGFSVAGLGDQNNDDHADILIGAPYFENGQTDEGKAYLHRGTSTGINGTAAWTVESNQSGSYLGYSVAGGPLNADDCSDILVGLPYHDTTGASLTDNGEAWFYLTDCDTGTPTYDDKIWGSISNDHLGSSVTYGKVTEHFYGFAAGAPDARTGGGTQQDPYIQSGTVLAVYYDE